MGDDAVHQLIGVAHFLGVEQVQTVPVEQSHHGLPGGIETERPGVRDTQWPAQPCRRIAVNTVAVVDEIAEQRGVGADHTFRFAGRAGGENHIRGLIGVPGDVRQRCGTFNRVVDHQDAPLPRRRRVAVLGDDDGRIGLVQHGFDAGRRHRDIDWEVGAAGGEHRQDGDDAAR